MSIDKYRDEADRLFEHLSRKHGVKLKKSSILESIAVLHGHADWNTLVAGVKASQSEDVPAPPPETKRLSFTVEGTPVRFDPVTTEPWRERWANARRARIEWAESHDTLEKLNFDQALSRVWIDSIIDNKSGLFLVCGPTGSGKTTTLFGTACELGRRGVKVAHFEGVEEFPRIDGHLYYPADALQNPAELAKTLRDEGVEVVFISDVFPHISCADELVQEGFRVVVDIHGSHARARLSALNVPEDVIDRMMVAALHVRVIWHPDASLTRLPLAHLYVRKASGETSMYGAPASLIDGVWDGPLSEHHLSVLIDFFGNARQTGSSRFEVRLVPKKSS